MAFENEYMSNSKSMTFAIANRCPMYIGAGNLAGIYKELGR